MPVPVAVRVARLSRRSVCAVVAVALSLTCIVFAAAASTVSTTGMVGEDGGLTTAAPAVAVGAFSGDLDDGAVDEVGREAVSPVASVKPSPAHSMCDSACVSDVIETCTVAAGLTVVSLLALFLATRRNTFMGLLARMRLRALPRQGRRQTPWTVLSPISLCVMRV